MRTAIAAIVLGLALVGCDGGGAGDQPTPTEPPVTPPEQAYGRECGDTMSAAAQLTGEQRAPDDIDPAIIACASFDEFAVALSDHPEAADGVDARTLVQERCEQSDDPEVRGSEICQEVADEGTGS